MQYILDYNKLNDSQKEYYDAIVKFGTDHNISNEYISLALVTAFAESDMGRLDASGTGPVGLFQYSRKQWDGRATCGGDGSIDAKATCGQLTEWGYKPGAMRRFNSDDQIAMFYADMVAVYIPNYENGIRQSGANMLTRKLGDDVS